MTERESDERIIEEMCIDIGKQCANKQEECISCDCRYCFIELLCNAGYRKQEVVEKRTAEAIFQAIAEMHIHTGYGLSHIERAYLRDVAKQFGSEVKL